MWFAHHLQRKSSLGTFSVTFSVNSFPIPVVSSYRDLGVTISSDLAALAPSLHITDIVGKARRRANMILRCSVSRDADLCLYCLCSPVTRI